MRSIFFVGPLPPPVHGFSLINEKMLGALRAQGSPVHVFDLAPHTRWAPFVQWFAFIGALLRAGRSNCSLYLPISGGLRQLIDLLFIVPARLMGWNIFVHHHSFAYLNKKPWHATLVFKVLRNAKHIVLCTSMGEKFGQQYGILPSNLRVLSNSAFLALSVNTVTAKPVLNAAITLGFLSNITAEKGIFKFLDAIDALHAQHIPCNVVVAGPVQPEIQADFDARLAAIPHARHIGPVYGDAKQQFFNSIDVLLFPTLYANEAEPVTLWEAMAQAIPVIALQRGCIQGMVPLAAGCIVEKPHEFVAAVVKEVTALSMSAELLVSRRSAAKDAFSAAQQQYQYSLKSLLIEMTHPNPKEVRP